MTQPPYPPQQPQPPQWPGQAPPQQQWPAQAPGQQPPAWGYGYGQPPAPQWRPEMVAHPHPEPRSYPLMLRTWDYHLWKPLVGIVVMIVGGLLVMPLLLLPVLLVGVAVEGGQGDFLTRFSDAASLKSVTPSAMLYLNLTLASLTLVAMGITRVVHRLRPRWLSSVRPGIRWKFLAVCFGLAVVALAVSIGVGMLLPDDPNDIRGHVNHLSGQLVATAIVILLTTPLQALGEEYAFRGYLMQAFGSLVDGIAAALGSSRRTGNILASTFAILLTSLLFAFAHGVQNWPLFIDRFAFGLMAGLVVVLVGGLEAGIALHVLNNLLAFALAITFGDLQSALTVSEVSWWQLPVTIAQNGVYLVLVVLVARAMKLRNRTAPEEVAVPQG